MEVRGEHRSYPEFFPNSYHEEIYALFGNYHSLQGITRVYDSCDGNARLLRASTGAHVTSIRRRDDGRMASHHCR